MDNIATDSRERSFIFLILSRCLRSVATIFAVLSLPLYLLNFTGIETIGIVFAISGLVTLLITLGGGFLGDRIGYKKVLMIVELPSIFGLTILALFQSHFMIFLAVAIGGTAGTPGAMRGAFSPGITPYVATLWKEQSERVKKLSLITAVGSFSALGGSGLLVLKNFIFSGYPGTDSFRYLYGISAVLMIASLLSLSMMLTDRPRKRSVRIMQKSSGIYTMKVVLGNVFNGAGLGLAIALLPAWLSLRFGTGSQTVGEIFTGSYLFTGISSYLASGISDLGREKHVLIGGLSRTFQGILLIVIAFMPSVLFVAIVYFVRSLIAGYGAPLRTAVNVQGISEGDYGSASSIQGVSMRAAQTTSGASGYLMAYDISLPILGGGILQGVGGLVYYWILKSRGSVDH